MSLISFFFSSLLLQVSVSQTELGSLISTAENLKIKGLAEPERPLEKSVKRLASPPRIQGNAMPLQHAPITLFQQSSPSAKRKRTETYVSHCAYTNSRVSEKEDKLPPNALSADNGPSQVLLLPPQDPGTPVAPTDLTPQQATSYVTHHPSLSANSEAGGVLYSVAGSAIYVGSSQGGGSNARGDIVREVYPSSADSYNSNPNSNSNNDNGNDDPGPSGVQTPHQNETSTMVGFSKTCYDLVFINNYFFYLFYFSYIFRISNWNPLFLSQLRVGMVAIKVMKMVEQVVMGEVGVYRLLVVEELLVPRVMLFLCLSLYIPN